MVKDVVRIERFVSNGHANFGAVVALTNDSWFWRKPASAATTGASEFRVHEGASLRGHRAWNSGAGPGTRRAREEALSLAESYHLRWADYCQVHRSTFSSPAT